MPSKIFDKLKSKITDYSYKLLKYSVWGTFLIAEAIALYDVFTVRIKNYFLSIDEPLNNLLTFCDLFKYPLSIIILYVGMFRLLVAIKPKEKIIKSYLLDLKIQKYIVERTKELSFGIIINNVNDIPITILGYDIHIYKNNQTLKYSDNTQSIIIPAHESKPANPKCINSEFDESYFDNDNITVDIITRFKNDTNYKFKSSFRYDNKVKKFKIVKQSLI